MAEQPEQVAAQPEHADLDYTAISQDVAELDTIIQRLCSRWPSGTPPVLNERSWQFLNGTQEQYVSAVLEMRQALRTLRRVKDAVSYGQ